MTDLPLTTLTRVRRGAHHQRTDRAALYDVIDTALYATLAIVRDDRPVALPVGIGRDGDDLLVHGSTGSDFFRRIAAGAPVSLTITHLMGLKYARSLFDSSMRYRCAVVHAVASVVPPEEKEAALLTLSEHLMPGRSEDVRPMTAREIAATMVLRIPLAQASVKDNAGSLVEEDGDVLAQALESALLALVDITGDDPNRPAVSRPGKVAKRALEEAGVGPEDLAAFIPHQANMRIIDEFAKQLGLPDTVAIARDIETMGNTSAASIPLATHRLLEEHPELSGGLALQIGFGAGLVYGAQVVVLP